MAKEKRKTASGWSPLNVALGLGAFALGSAALVAAALFGTDRPKRREGGAQPSNGGGEHPVPDLAADGNPGAGGRAPDAFRPDPTAPVPPEMRESLRPATAPAPTMSGGETIVSTLERD